ncbi:MAG: hypothetical protein M3Q08_01020 [Pseudomonadota bacterium]|nr:hypothetical protein [Pseudomonadota bacterium]
MSATLHEFPRSARRAPVSPTPVAPCGRLSEQEFGLFDIARRLGRGDATVRTLVGLVQQLILRKGFPPPKGYRQWKGELLQGWQAVCAKSRWPRAAVEAWFDNAFPQLAEAETEAEHAAWADRLDQNAAFLSAPAEERVA